VAGRARRVHGRVAAAPRQRPVRMGAKAARGSAPAGQNPSDVRRRRRDAKRRLGSMKLQVDETGTTNQTLDRSSIDALTAALRRARDEVARMVVGQQDVVDQLLVAMICGGHVLLEGAPGVGKTL